MPNMNPLCRHSPTSMLCALLTLLMLSGTALADKTTDRFDILGFRLGMVPDEVESVFYGLNPEVKLQTRNGVYPYSDGLRRFQTEEFLDQISGMIRYDRATSASLHVTVTFSPPPEGGKVVQIIRHENKIANPVTLAEYKEALVGKYGPPTTELYGLQWHFPDSRSLCTRSANSPVADNLSTLAQGNDRDQKLADPSQCASYLTFRMTGDPVKEVSAKMVDVENAIRAQLAAGAWVADLKARAVAKRKAAGQGPEL